MKPKSGKEKKKSGKEKKKSRKEKRSKRKRKQSNFPEKIRLYFLGETEGVTFGLDRALYQWFRLLLVLLSYIWFPLILIFSAQFLTAFG